MLEWGIHWWYDDLCVGTTGGFTIQYCISVSDYRMMSKWMYIIYSSIIYCNNQWLYFKCNDSWIETTGNPEYEVSFTSQKHSLDKCQFMNKKFIQCNTRGNFFKSSKLLLQWNYLKSNRTDENRQKKKPCYNY